MTAMQDRRDILPRSLPPRGLSRVESARYLGIGLTLFEELVHDGTLPGPKRLRGRTVWDRIELDAAFEALPTEGAAASGSTNPWD